MLKKLIAVGLLANALCATNCVFAECTKKGVKVTCTNAKLKAGQVCCCRVSDATSPNGKCYSCSPTTLPKGTETCPADPSDPKRVEIRMLPTGKDKDECLCILDVGKKP